jgi:hypothetical protein
MRRGTGISIRPIVFSSLKTHRWEDMRMDLMEIGWEVVGWIHLAQDRDQ